MNEKAITPIEDKTESISFIDEIINTQEPDKIKKSQEDANETEKIKLPEWDLLPPFETIDRSEQND